MATDSSRSSERTLMKRINQGVSEANDNADGKLNSPALLKGEAVRELLLCYHFDVF